MASLKVGADTLWPTGWPSRDVWGSSARHSLGAVLQQKDLPHFVSSTALGRDAMVSTPASGRPDAGRTQ